MILQILFPAMDENTVTLRADNYSSNCCKYFVSSKTAVICEQYISYKITWGNNNTVLKISNLVTQNEAANSQDRISTTHYLPESACRMDLQMFTCSNFEDLVVASVRLNISDKRSKSPYDKKNDKSFLPTEIILNPHLKAIMTRQNQDLHMSKETVVHQRTDISEKIQGEDNIRAEVTGMKRITNINQGGIDPKLLLETDTLKGEMEAQTGINHQVIEIEETTRGNQVRGLPAIPGVDHQCIEIAEHKPAFSVEIAI